MGIVVTPAHQPNLPGFVSKVLLVRIHGLCLFSYLSVTAFVLQQL